MSYSARKRYVVKFITLPVNNDSEPQAIDDFCVLADNDRDLPSLRHGKKWANYRLSPPEWRVIELTQDCLKVLSACCHI